jgi:hypothetical protein
VMHSRRLFNENNMQYLAQEASLRLLQTTFAQMGITCRDVENAPRALAT